MEEYKLTWDLNSIFSGGSHSKELEDYVKNLQERMEQLRGLVDRFTYPMNPEQTKDLMEIIDHSQDVIKRLREFGAFSSCLSAQDVEDKQAQKWVTRRSEMAARYQNIQLELDQKLLQTDDNIWKSLISEPEIREVAFILDERREKAKEKLAIEIESIINNLAVDGYHGWGQMYDAIVGKMTLTLDGKELSMGQASNRMTDGNREVRQEVFKKWQEVWSTQADLFTETLNHLAGFRLHTYKHRGWENPLKEPLSYNRMSEDTLNAMWTAINKYKSDYLEYFDEKAKWLGVEKLSIFDVNAPIGKTEKKMDYQTGAQFIIDHFRTISPLLADFTEMAFEKSWIEAEDRPGKRPGGFCTSFPHSQETRIFMTYSGTLSNVATLAHELGHAYHQHVMNEMPIFNQGYAMNVAETASTFAEMIVSDAAVNNASDDRERLILLEDKIQRSVAFFMNIHSRFLFETSFYEERKHGAVSTERLNELMVEAQREAYKNSLEEYDPTFWASKLHFHITGVPFYNFPYTFGYLFSLGIYAIAVKEGTSFESRYISLLQDTGRMTVEELAEKHLGADLEKTEFWEEALKLCMKDVTEFMELSRRLRTEEGV
ncbi:M3 family oligoendopeptidase [Halobacillus sp. Marseille-Q1614]|uniref:M3 family oligoendopeptidase n=1 Tax=Halobacillus sp. Marseille-Q1614 TaxID=2709134 RepID=UPI00156E9521|nr:M3 family oligoendopeptidase [Halobacillus sp. Marseille-Q1614]